MIEDTEITIPKIKILAHKVEMNEFHQDKSQGQGISSSIMALNGLHLKEIAIATAKENTSKIHIVIVLK